MITVHEISRVVNGIVLNGTTPDKRFCCAFASDLMSDVLTVDQDGMVLLTGLSTLQTMRTAEMLNIHCVVVTRGKRVTNEMLILAKENDIAVISCSSSMYAASGRLYENGIKPVY